MSQQNKQWLDPINNPPIENVKYWVLCADNSTHKARCFDKVWINENHFIIFDVVGYAEYKEERAYG